MIIDNIEPIDQRITLMVTISEKAKFLQKCLAEGTTISEKGRLLVGLYNRGLEYNFSAAEDMQTLIDTYTAYAEEAMYYKMKFNGLLDFCKKNKVQVPAELLVQLSYK